MRVGALGKRVSSGPFQRGEAARLESAPTGPSAELMELVKHQIDEDSCYGDIHPNREGDFRDAAVRGKTFLPREIERAEGQRDDEEC